VADVDIYYEFTESRMAFDEVEKQFIAQLQARPLDEEALSRLEHDRKVAFDAMNGIARKLNLPEFPWRSREAWRDILGA
jgi:hypothetical protein